ncbi:MAG: prolyl oligopeptidase family serine peptidase [Proteobacteria bacterium]|nr:prolyl oligopeptidase family serine peptidase [Pseudomonadota bacterium]
MTNGIRALLRLSACAMALAWSLCVNGADIENGRIVSDAPWPPLPQWAELDDFTHGYFTQTAYDHARTQTAFDVRDIRYLSDGLTIRGILIRPKRPGSQKWPAIIFNRGGTGDYGRIGNYGVPCKEENDSCLYLVDLLMLAEKGFVVIASDYRFHGPPGKRDEWGGVEVDDILNLFPTLQGMDFVDSTRLYMLGQSRGGTMTYIALKHGAPVRAAAVIAGPSLLSAETRTFIHGDWFLKGNEWFDGAPKVWPDYTHRANEYYQERSGALWPDQINAPILIMHSRTDKLVPVSQALMMAEALQSHDRVYSLVIYGSDSHSLSNNSEDRTRRIVDWFDQYGAHAAPK